jgi:hypothetical protein
MMHLGLNFKLEKTAHGIKLLHKVEGYNPKKKEITIKWEEGYHQNLYQALQRTIDISCDPTKDFGYILKDIEAIMTTIDNKKEELKREFRTEVRVEK